MMRRALWTVVLWMAIAASPVWAQAQDPLAHIRDLYSNADYEDVLSALAADDSPPPPELGQYKVFSLIALDRVADAEKAAEAVMIANPRFQPDRDASPRVLDLFTKVRQRIAPELLKSMYVNAKASLDRKDRDEAIRAFGEIVAIANEPDLRDDKVVADIRLLASGFLDLSRALPVAPPPAPTPPARSAASATSPAPSASPALPQVTAPIPVNETMPPWIPSEALAHTEFRGRILLRIDAQGKVVSSEMLASATPVYDALLLRASKQWTYKPGQSDGRPVPSERIVEVVLKPR